MWVQCAPNIYTGPNTFEWGEKNTGNNKSRNSLCFAEFLSVPTSRMQDKGRWYHWNYLCLKRWIMIQIVILPPCFPSKCHLVVCARMRWHIAFTDNRIDNALLSRWRRRMIFPSLLDWISFLWWNWISHELFLGAIVEQQFDWGVKLPWQTKSVHFGHDIHMLLAHTRILIWNKSMKKSKWFGYS